MLLRLLECAWRLDASCWPINSRELPPPLTSRRIPIVGIPWTIGHTYCIVEPLHKLNMSGRTRPIEKFAEATAKCAQQGAVYGKCVAANYQNVKKDMCIAEFMALKDCYLVDNPVEKPRISIC